MKASSRPWQERLERFVRDQGGRMTKQRLKVADVFFSMGGHPGAEDVVREVRKRHPEIGSATVYRTIKLLRDSGLVEAREFGERFCRYEAHRPEEHHDHLICIGCGKIIEFGEEAIEALQERVARQYGFEMHQHRLDIWGLCIDCVRAKRRAEPDSEPLKL